MKRKSAGNKAHLQPVTHFFVHIGVSIARVVFQCSGTKFRYVTLVMLTSFTWLPMLRFSLMWKDGNGVLI